MGIVSEVKEKAKNASLNAVEGGKNIIRRKIRERYRKFHYKKAGERYLPTYKKYEPMVTYMGVINTELITEIEPKFGDMNDKIIPVIEKLYRMIGPYHDWEFAQIEEKMTSMGTAYDEDTGQYDLGRRAELIKINIPESKTKEKEYGIPIPKPVKIWIPADKRVESFSFFGYNSKAKKFWIETYGNVVDKICEAYKNKHGGDEEGKFIDKVASVYKRKLIQLFGSPEHDVHLSLTSIEKQYYDFLKKVRAQVEAETADFISLIWDNLPKKVRFKHTYFIAEPNAFDKETVKVIGKLKNYINPPVDPRGMPWEVDGEGNILVLKWRDDNSYQGDERLTLEAMKKVVPDFEWPRINTADGKVPKHFIKRCDCLKVANWVNNEWDAYRDDLRDGRYHPASLTILDYMMANHEAIGKEWEEADETDRRLMENRRMFTMEMPDRSTPVHGRRNPSDICPAFDLEFFKDADPETGQVGVPKEEWEHVGRVFYYDDFSGIFTHIQKQPIVTTRGIAMFLIDKFLSEGMLDVEVHDDLKEIGKKSGFDYGPRVMTAPLCDDPFNIDIASVNASFRGGS